MAFTPKTWSDLPVELQPEAGETLAEWFARIAAYNTANPGVLTPLDEDGLNDLEGRVDTGFADADSDPRLSDQRVPTDGSVTAAKVAGSLKPSGSAAAADESLRRLGTGATHAAAGDDSRLPTTGQKNALAGTAGTPGTGNEYATKQTTDALSAATTDEAAARVSADNALDTAKLAANDVRVQPQSPDPVNLGAAKTVTFAGAEERWLPGILSVATLAITVDGTPAKGARLLLLVAQDGAGDRAVTVDFGAGPDPVAVETAPNEPTRVVMEFDGAEWHVSSSATVAISQLLPFSKAGALIVGALPGRVPIPFDAVIESVQVMVGTAPTGAALIVDVHKNGTTIFTTQADRPEIAAGATASAAEVPQVTPLAPGDYLTVDVDQIGSTVAGSDLTGVVRYRQA